MVRLRGLIFVTDLDDLSVIVQVDKLKYSTPFVKGIFVSAVELFALAVLFLKYC